jgi:hypothetical protein
MPAWSQQAWLIHQHETIFGHKKASTPSEDGVPAKLLTNSPYHSIDPGDLCDGNAFLEPVCTLVEETFA